MRLRFAAALIASVAAVGCASLAGVPAGTLTPAGAAQGTTLVSTSTGLSQANYRVVRTGVTGESRGFVLLIFFNVVPTSVTNALDRLYEAAGLEPGGSWALANVVLEQQSRSFLLFALPRVRVRADVVEFVPADQKPRPAPAQGTHPHE